MTKKEKIYIGIAAGAIAAYFIVVWWRNHMTAQNSTGSGPTGSLGSNLNSVAPELVGGSSGPSVGPALSVPVNITLTSTEPPESAGNVAMQGVNAMTPSSLARANPPASSSSGTDAGTVTSTGAASPPPGRTPVRRQDRTKGGADNTHPENKKTHDEQMANRSKGGKK